MDWLYSLVWPTPPPPPPLEHDTSQLVVAALAALLPLALCVMMPSAAKYVRKVCNVVLLLQMIVTGVMMVASSFGIMEVPDELRYTEVGKADKFAWGAEFLAGLSPAFIGLTAPNGMALLSGTCQLLAAVSFLTGIRELTAEVCAAVYYSLILYAHYVLVDNMIVPCVFIGACFVKIEVDNAKARYLADEDTRATRDKRSS